MTIKSNIINSLALFCIIFFTTSFTLENKVLNADESYSYKYIIYLKNKNGTPFTIEKPEQFLSAKAIAKRKKQNITIDELDLPANPTYIAKISEQKNVKIVYTSKWLNAAIVEVQNEHDMDAIEDFDFVKGIKILGKWEIKKADVNNKIKKIISDDFEEYDTKDKEDVASTKVSLDEIINRGYGKSFNQNRMINIIKMHDMGFKGEGITIAVIDGGFKNYYRHRAFDSLRLNKQILGHYNIATNHSNINDNGSHGTSVLSCMGGNINDVLVGTAPKSSFYLIETEAANSEFPIEAANWVRGAEIADSLGTDIITSSLGYRSFNDAAMNYTYQDLDGKKALATLGASIAAQKGMMVLVAAGNEGDSKGKPTKKNPNIGWRYISSPADADGILTVGGVNDTKDHTDFSSIGPTFDKRIKPDVCAKAKSVYVANGTNNFEYSNGTSFATPIMAGAVACLMQANPSKTNQEIMEALKKSGDNSHAPDNDYGWGIPDLFLAHSFLTKNPYFNYEEEQLMSPVLNTFYERFVFRFYSPKNQDVTVKLTYLDGKKPKVVYNVVHSAKAQEVLQGNIPKMDKFLLGKYQFQLINSNGKVYERSIERKNHNKLYFDFYDFF